LLNDMSVKYNLGFDPSAPPQSPDDAVKSFSLPPLDLDNSANSADAKRRKAEKEAKEAAEFLTEKKFWKR
jgi:hypothetical protein